MWAASDTLSKGKYAGGFAGELTGIIFGIKFGLLPVIRSPISYVMDDEDEFVDAVSENEESVKAHGSDEEDGEGGADDGFGDDDFGDFAAEESDEEENNGHEEYDPEVEQQTQKLEEVRISQPVIQQSPPEPLKPPLVSPLRNAPANSETIRFQE